MDFDDTYDAAPDIFGAAPEPTLVRHAEALDPARPVLDVGAGQGRNSLWLARRGVTVVGLEPARRAASALQERADADALPLRLTTEGFAEHTAPHGGYGGVLLFGLVPILRWAEIDALAGAVKR